MSCQLSSMANAEISILNMLDCESIDLEHVKRVISCDMELYTFAQNQPFPF